MRARASDNPVRVAHCVQKEERKMFSEFERKTAAGKELRQRAIDTGRRCDETRSGSAFCHFQCDEAVNGESSVPIATVALWCELRGCDTAYTHRLL